MKKQIKKIILSVCALSALFSCAPAFAQVQIADRYIRYVASSGQTIFDIDFPLAEASDVSVYEDGTLLDTSAYDVDLTALTVTLHSGATTGQIIWIEGDRQIQRTNEYPPRGGLATSRLNEDFDGVTESLQEARRDLDRALTLGHINSPAISNVLPPLDQGKALVWGANGIENSDGNFDDILSTANAAAASAAADAVAVAGDVTAANSAASAAAASQAGAASSASAAATSAGAASSSASSASTNAAALLASWKGTWLTSTAYAIGDRVYDGGSSYICTSAHTSGASTEPGVGGSWTTKWDILALKGSSGAGSGDVVAANNGSEYSAMASAFRTNLGLTIGTNIEAWDADLDALAGASYAANKMSYWTGTHAIGLIDTTSFGRSLLDAADAAGLRTLAGAGTVSTLASDTDGALAADSDSNVATQKAVKTYVDANAGGEGTVIATTSLTGLTTADVTWTAGTYRRIRVEIYINPTNNAFKPVKLRVFINSSVDSVGDYTGIVMDSAGAPHGGADSSGSAITSGGTAWHLFPGNGQNNTGYETITCENPEASDFFKTCSLNGDDGFGAFAPEFGTLGVQNIGQINGVRVFRGGSSGSFGGGAFIRVTGWK